jgi:hypothetical protein
MRSYFSLFILLLIGFLLFGIGVFIPVWFIMTRNYRTQPYAAEQYMYDYSREESEEAMPAKPAEPPLQTREDIDGVLKEVDGTDLNTLDAALKENDRDAATF